MTRSKTVLVFAFVAAICATAASCPKGASRTDGMRLIEGAGSLLNEEQGEISASPEIISIGDRAAALAVKEDEEARTRIQLHFIAGRVSRARADFPRATQHFMSAIGLCESDTEAATAAERICEMSRTNVRRAIGDETIANAQLPELNSPRALNSADWERIANAAARFENAVFLAAVQTAPFKNPSAAEYDAKVRRSQLCHFHQRFSRMADWGDDPAGEQSRAAIQLTAVAGLESVGEELPGQCENGRDAACGDQAWQRAGFWCLSGSN